MTTLLTSRKFWALLIGLLVMILAQFIPGFALDEETAIGFVIVVASYIVGVAVDPGPGGWRGVIQSRKFWAAAIGLLLVLMDGFGLRLPAEVTPDVLVWVCVTIGAYISGVALESKWLVMAGEIGETDDNPQ